MYDCQGKNRAEQQRPHHRPTPQQKIKTMKKHNGPTMLYLMVGLTFERTVGYTGANFPKGSSPMPTDPMPNDWENPALLHRNRLPAHATSIPYADKETALRGERGASPFFRLLNGHWQFQYLTSPEDVPPAFSRRTSTPPTGTSCRFRATGRCMGMGGPSTPMSTTPTP